MGLLLAPLPALPLAPGSLYPSQSLLAGAEGGPVICLHLPQLPAM